MDGLGMQGRSFHSSLGSIVSGKEAMVLEWSLLLHGNEFRGFFQGVPGGPEHDASPQTVLLDWKGDDVVEDCHWCKTESSGE